MIGLLALLFVAPTVVDWNRYRGVFEEEASRFLGREVRLGGSVNLRLLPVPFVRFEQVRIADTAASVGKPLFMAEDLTIWLSVGGLLRGGLEASAVELNRPIVTLVLDGNGGGSWSSLAPGKWSSALGPAGITFNAVQIHNGSLSILSPSGASRAAFEHINGELSAAAIEGPYKLSAAFSAAKSSREIRLSTAKPAEDGSVRIKGTVRDPAAGMSYTVDGQIQDVLGRTRLTGDLVARLPLLSLESPDAPRRQPTGEFDLRAKLAADTSGLQLKDLALSFEQAGRPQLASGEAQVTWADATEIKLALKSRWLDLDRIAGGGDVKTSPLRLVHTLAQGIANVLASEGRTEAQLTLEQATLGGDVVSDLSVTLERLKGKLAIRNLAAILPGGTRISATGAFDVSTKDPDYDGRLDLRGASLARFAGWAGGGKSPVLPAHDGAFSAGGDVSLRADGVTGRKMILRLAENDLTGDITWKAGKQGEIIAKLEGSEIDVTPLLDPALPPVAAIRQMITGLAGKPEPSPSGGAAGPGSTADVLLRVDRLMAGKAAFRDVAVEFRINAGNLTVPQLRFASDDGYAVDVRGDVDDFAQPGAKGNLMINATADKPGGVVALASLLELPADFAPAPERAIAALPLRMAGSAQIGARGPGQHNLVADGNLGPSRISASLRFGAPAATWRDRVTDFAVTVDGRDAAGLFWGVAHRNTLAAGAAARDDARLVLRGVGTARSGLKTLATVADKGVDVTYRGTINLDDTGNFGLDGETTFDIADTGRAFALAGIPLPVNLTGPASGKVAVARKAGRLSIASANVDIDGARLSGTMAIEPAVAGSYRLTGDLKSDRASLPGLLAALARDRAGARPESTPSPWSGSALDFGPLDRMAGSRLRVATSRFKVAPDLSVTDAALDVTVKPGGIEVRLVDSKAMGGHAAGVVALDRAPAGIALTAEGRLTGGRLEALAQTPAQSAATGGVSFSLKGSSIALTPRGLIVALAGSGTLTLDRANLRRWNPAAVGTAAEAVIAAKGEGAPGALRELLSFSLTKSGIGLGSPRLGLKLADGTFHVAPLVAATPNGKLTGNLTVDLDSQRLDGEWRIEPRVTTPTPAGAAAKPDLPPVAIIYAGPMAGLTAIEPRLDIDALEREVAVRKVEREVAELERLRALDEDRIRQDAQRRLDEQRQEDLRRRELEKAPNALAPPNVAAPTGPAGVGVGTERPGAAGAAVAPPQTPPTTVTVAPLPQPARRPANPPPLRPRDPFSRLRDSGG